MTYNVEKSDAEWRAELSPQEYQVLRQAGTERAFTGEYTDTETKGVYKCKACQATLFESDTKFHSGCGWPSFYQPVTDTIEYIDDSTMGMKRTEVRCANCGSHLGHVFPTAGMKRTEVRCANCGSHLGTSSPTATARRPATATASTRSLTLSPRTGAEPGHAVTSTRAPLTITTPAPK